MARARCERQKMHVVAIKSFTKRFARLIDNYEASIIVENNADKFISIGCLKVRVPILAGRVQY